MQDRQFSTSTSILSVGASWGLWLSTFTTLFCVGGYAEEVPLHRVYSQLFIKNFPQATREAEIMLARDPENRAVRMALMRAQCRNGDIDGAFTQWERLEKSIDDEGTYRSLIEALAWGILSKHANQITVHMSSIIGAALTQDARALPILLSGLSSPNAIIRSISAKFSANYRDAKVVKRLITQLKVERVWYVKIELIQTLGQLRVLDALPALEAIISHEKTPLEERSAAISAVCSIREDTSREEIVRMVHSNRAGERHLATRIVVAFAQKECLPDIEPLLTDPCPEVRVGAINAFTLLNAHSEHVQKTLKRLMEDAHGEVAITAGWALAYAGNPVGYASLKMWLLSPYAHLRQIAASALAFFAYEHEQELLELMRDQTDPYVRLNIARGILCSGSSSKNAQAEIALFTSRMRQRIMSTAGLNPLFRVISASNVRHTVSMQQYPLYIDCVTRLELINILAVRRHKDAEVMLKGFLSNTQLGVSFNAALILVQEGVDESLEIVEKLLNDPQEAIRLQAALILAYMGEEEKAYPILAEAYTNAPRTTKIHILQAMGSIRSDQSIAFLLQVMKDPFLVLRVVSASSLIQSVYN